MAARSSFAKLPVATLCALLASCSKQESANSVDPSVSQAPLAAEQQEVTTTSAAASDTAGNAAPTDKANSEATDPEAANPEAANPEAASDAPTTDVLATSAGSLSVTPIHHGTMAFEFKGKSIWIDPWSKGELTKAPKADYLFLTDIHQDHLDLAAITSVEKSDTQFIAPKAVADQLTEKQLGARLHVMANGETKTFDGFSVEATPMYNLTRGPEPGKLFHEKGRGNGYLFTFGDKRVYVSGDTACTPEMKALQNIDVAFVCMNLPYTMPPEEAAECVTQFKPGVVYPFHYRGSDLEAFKTRVSAAGIEVRLRNWY